MLSNIAFAINMNV